MRTATTLDIFRRLQSAALAGNDVLKKAHYIGFGKGAHNPDGSLKPFDATRESMFDRVVLKPIISLTQPTLYITRAKAFAMGDELPVVSEAALFDEDERIIAMAIFKPKFTEPGERYSITLQARF